MGQIGRQNAPQPFDVYKKDEVYSKTEQDITDNAQDSVDALKANAADVYTKTEVNNLPTASFKNKLTNGGFDVWQRGDVFTSISSTQYVADRWRFSPQTATATITKSTSTIGIDSALRVANESSGGLVSINQRIEGGVLNGKTATFSVYIQGSSALNTVYLALARYEGSGHTVESLIQTTPVAMPTTNTKLSFTVDIPVASQAIDSGSYYQVSIVQQNITSGDFFTIRKVQLEEGSVATPFENRPIGAELALCQRYYEICYSSLEVYGSVGGSISKTTDYKVTKRTNPSIVVTDNGSVNISNINNGSQIWVDSVRVLGSAGTTGHVLHNIKILLDAEL